MTIRLTLLVLLTGLFAAAWSSDARDGAQRRLARARQAADFTVARIEPVVIDPVVIDPVVIELPAPIEEPADARRDSAAGPVLPAPSRSEFSTKAEIDARPVHWQAPRARAATEIDGVPLPRGIRPGTYRVVSNQGEVRSLQLKADDLGGASVDGARDLYLYRDGESRWYFVRLDDVPEEVLPPAVAEYPAELVAERATRRAAGRVLVRIGQRLHTAVAGPDETPEEPEPVSRIAAIRHWIGGLLPDRPTPMWSGRPAEAERR